MPRQSHQPANAKHAATFFGLSLVVLLLPILLPARRPNPPPRENTVQVAAIPPATSSTPGEPPTPSVAPTPIGERTASPVISSTPSNERIGPLGPASGAGNRTSEIDWTADNTGPGFDFKEKLQSVILSLLFITALIFLTLKALQKIWPNLGKAVVAEQPLMNVLAQQTVAPGVHLSLVQVCNKNVLIGFTEHSVSVLCEISAEEMDRVRQANAAQAAEAAEGAEPAKTPGEVYREILHRYLSIFPGFGAKR